MSERVQRAKDAQQKRAKGSKSPTQGNATEGGNGLNFYSGEVSALKVQPNTVLIISLVYLGVVVLLHILSKIRSGGSEATATE